MTEKEIENKPKTQKELEREKLLLEIEELKKKWWKKPSYIAALFPTVLALVTLIYGFTNGYFQASFIKLENQKHDLVIEKEKLKAEINEMVQESEEKRKELDSLMREQDRNFAELRKLCESTLQR